MTRRHRLCRLPPEFLDLCAGGTEQLSSLGLDETIATVEPECPIEDRPRDASRWPRHLCVGGRSDSSTVTVWRRPGALPPWRRLGHPPPRRRHGGGTAASTIWACLLLFTVPCFVLAATFRWSSSWFSCVIALWYSLASSVRVKGRSLFCQLCTFSPVNS